MKKIISAFLFFSVNLLTISGQAITFTYEKAPKNGGFKMDNYWIWCGSMIKVGRTYHHFASRWEKTGPFPEGYRQNSEIVRATSNSPLGPFRFREVVIGERDSSFWDSNMAHNPTICRIGDEFVLFYIGSDFKTKNSNTGNLLRRVGYATSKSIDGPWSRSHDPVISTESNNPAILVDSNRIILVFRDENLRVYLSESDSYYGPYNITNYNLWPDSKIEDFFLFKANGQYHMICEDNAGGISGHQRWGVHLFSPDDLKSWQKYDPVIAYDHDIYFSDNSVLHCVRRERPQLLITRNKITHIITGVYDGNDSWSIPVELKKQIKVK